MSSAENFWLTPPAKLMLSRDEVHVWRATLDLPDVYLDELQHRLAPDEIRRAKRFRLHRDRHRFIVGRGLLRAILSRYLSIAPHQIFFSYTAYGKPLLAPSVNQDSLNFNTSHSGGLAVYAITRERAIGVDIEHNRNNVDYHQLAMRFFSPAEYAQLCSLPPEIQQKAFFTGWTCKEAYIKARGAGLSLPLDQFTVALAPHQPAQLLHTNDDPSEASRWSLQALRPGLDYTAALCVEGQGWRLTCWQWPEEWTYRRT